MNLPLERFRFLSTDKITGRTFKLCAEGESEDAAAEKIWELGFLVSGVEACPWIQDSTLKPKGKFRDEEYYLDESHCEGQVSRVLRTNFGEMVKHINTECDLEDRHWLLNELVLATERSTDASYQMFCELFCWQWFVERHELTECLMQRCSEKRETMYEVPAVDRLRIIHDGERAAQVCDYATSMKYPMPSQGWLLKKAIEYRAKSP